VQTLQLATSTLMRMKHLGVPPSPNFCWHYTCQAITATLH